MNWMILAPALVLIAAMLMAALLLLADGRAKKITARVEQVSAAGAPLPGDAALSLRRDDSGGSVIADLLARLVGAPADLAKPSRIPPEVTIGVGAAVGALAGALASNQIGTPFAVLLGFVLFCVVPRLLFRRELKSYQATLRQQLPDAIEMIVSATRAGLPLLEAFRGVVTEIPSPTSDEFARIVNIMTLGGSPGSALLDVARRTDVSEYAIFAVTLGVQGRTGGRLAETIQKLAETVRYRLAATARAKALAGEATVSAVILGGLPFVAGIVLSITRPGYLDPLFTDPRGIRLIYIAAAGLILGILTMRQLIRNATSE